MKAKTELLLYRLLWLADTAARPGFRNLGQSFEGWAYRNGLRMQIQRLEAQGLLEVRTDPRSGERLHRLTEAGRLAAMGGRDPEASWATPWDRKWRLFVFDIPEEERSKRRKLTRALGAAGCGCLQGSVWIAPKVPPELESLVAEEEPECSQLVLLLADSKGRDVDGRMVAAAWDFDAVNARYRDVLTVLDRFPPVAKRCDRRRLADWTAEESAAWRGALAGDPLLPRELLPKHYLGRKVWRRRRSVLAKAARLTAALGGSADPG